MLKMTASLTAILAPVARDARVRTARHAKPSDRREFCHFAETPSPSVLKRLLEVEGGASEWQ